MDYVQKQIKLYIYETCKLACYLKKFFQITLCHFKAQDEFSSLCNVMGHMCWNDTNNTNQFK